MRSVMPPDHDPELRRALALNEEDQSVLLSRMCGPGSQPPAAHSPEPSSTFQPVGGTLTEKPGGALSWLPTPWPASAMAHWDDHTLTICLEHFAIADHARPRIPEARAKLQADLDALLPKRGTITVPFTPRPSDWSRADLRRLVHLLLNHVAAENDNEARRTAEIFVGVERSACRARLYGAAELRVSVAAGWSALIRLEENAADPLRDILRAVDAATCGHATLPLWQFEKLSAAAGTSKPGRAATVGGDESEDEEDDDSGDVEHQMILTIVQRRIQPDATWQDIGPYIRLIREFLKVKYGFDKGER